MNGITMLIKLMKYSIYFILIFFMSCGDDDSIFQEPDISTICSTIVAASDEETAFRADINGQEWIADSIINARLFEEFIILEAISKRTNGEITRMRVEIRNPDFGVNSFDLRTSNQFIFETFKDDQLIVSRANCGYINLTKFNRASSTVSGTFQVDINGRPTDPSNIDITNGAFNDLEWKQVFCAPDFEELDMETEIFNTFKLIGIFESDDELVSFPPCDSETTITFAKSDLNGFERITISGETIFNRYQARVFNLNDTGFTTEDFTVTVQSGLPYELTFEAQFIQLIANTRITYTLEGNILTISNAALGRKMKLALL